MLQFLHIIFVIVLVVFDIYCMQYSNSHGLLSSGGINYEASRTYTMYMGIATVLLLAYAFFFYFTYKQIKFIRCIIYPLGIVPVFMYLITIFMCNFAGLFMVTGIVILGIRFIPRWALTLFLYGYNLDKEDKYNKYR